jgi:hypothetical protein
LRLPHPPSCLCSAPHRALLTLPAAIPVTRNPRRGRAGAGAAGAELAAIFRVMADLLGDPAWPQLHPRSCTNTSWPGLQCKLVPDDARVLRATRLHLGPDVATPPFRLEARLDPASLCGLPHLQTLSIFYCFNATQAPVELPLVLFTSSSSLEQIVLKCNPGLIGPILATLVLILVNIVLCTPMISN